jgi:methyl-accepting chemotaxis protein
VANTVSTARRGVDQVAAVSKSMSSLSIYIGLMKDVIVGGSESMRERTDAASRIASGVERRASCADSTAVAAVQHRETATGLNRMVQTFVEAGGQFRMR